MNTMISPKKKLLVVLLLITILSVPLLTACAGRTVIDVNIDPETGEGDIVIDPVAPPADDGSADTGGGGTTSDTQMSQIALFAVIAALFIGVVAIVIAVSRRPGREE